MDAHGRIPETRLLYDRTAEKSLTFESASSTKYLPQEDETKNEIGKKVRIRRLTGACTRSRMPNAAVRQRTSISLNHMFSIVLVSTLVLWLSSTLLLIPFANQVSKRRKLNQNAGKINS